VCDPRTKTRGSWVFRDRIDGALEYLNSIKENKFDVKEISGIQCPDDTTLVITLKQPFAPFLSILTMPYGFVYPREAVEYYKDNFGYNPVGTGPFRFVKWEVDKELVMEKNPTFWRKNKAGYPFVYLDGIKVTFTKSSETAFLDFKEGRLDYYEPSPEVLSQITDENGSLNPGYDFELVKQPWLNTVYLAMQLDNNMPGGANNPLLGSKKLRQAINYGIDRHKIIKYVLKFRGIPGENGPIPKGMPGYSEEVIGYKFDKQRALQLLAEAGYHPAGGKVLTLKLTVANEDTQKLIGEAVQAQLRDIGIDVQLDFIQASTLRSSQVGGELAFWRANWGADYFDPENFMALLYSRNKTPNGPNYTHYSNPKVDELYDLAMKETDFEKRKKMYNEAERLVIEDSPWIILYYNEIVYLKNKRVADMYIDGLNTMILKRAKVF
jgi:peptide/nickel transport system substrate-binding protein